MSATPLSAEEIAYYAARLGDEPGGSMSEILMGRLLATIRVREAERDHVKRREADIIEACERVADGGQYRADIVAAIQRLRRERDEARALVRDLRDVGTVKIEHAYLGGCPDVAKEGAVSEHDRDDGCEACDVLRRADVMLGGDR